MNNKHLISTLVILAMAGCASYTKPIDKDVLKQNKISYTLDIYNIYEGKNLNNISSIKKEKAGDAQNVTQLIVFGFATMGLTWLLLPIIERKYDYTTLMEQQALKCHYLKDNSDECIIYRRNHSQKDSEIGFFDYKRFLPKNSAVKTDTDFLLLVNKYKEYKNDENNKLKNCYEINKDNSLTFTERQEKYNQCQLYNENKNKKIEKLLKLYIFEGGLEDEKKQEQLKKEFERQKEELERQKAELVRQQQIAYQNDCDQAEKKADEANKKLENYKEKINYNNLHDLNKYKVVDFATKGVMLEYNYNSPRYFVYTTDKNYANGDYFHGGEYYYTKSNNVYKYTTIFGGINSISILIPTRYKVKDIEEMEKQTDYHSHLKNKNILSCWIYIYYKDENGEEVMIRRE